MDDLLAVIAAAGSGGPQTPADLSSVACWFAPAYSTMYQESGTGTPSTLVTTDADPVGRIYCAAGSGIYLYATSDGNRMAYDTDLGVPNLLTAGGPHLIGTSAGQPSGMYGSGISHFKWHVGKLTNNAGEYRTGFAHVYNQFGWILGTTNTGPTVFRDGLGNGSSAATGTTTMTSIYNVIAGLASHYDADTDDMKRYRNESLIATATDFWTGDVGAHASDRLCIGATAGVGVAGNYWVGHHIDCGVLVNPSADDITFMLNWIGGLTS